MNDENRNSKIIRLTAENVKRLKAVEIHPDGSLVVVGGDNGQGKSSLLDSIFYTLGGKGGIPVEPVRRGEKRGKSEVELDDFIIRRTFSPGGGTTLVITNKPTETEVKSPQALLDSLVGKLSFDPLEFAKGTSPQDDRRRFEVLRSLVGIDFTEVNQRRQQLFDQRTLVNRDVDSLKARFAALPPKYEGVPADEQSAASIIEEQRIASETNRVNAETRQKVTDRKRDWDEAISRVGSKEQEIKDLHIKLGQAKEDLESLQLERDEAELAHTKAMRVAEPLQDIDPSPFKAKAADVESVNAKVRTNKQISKLDSELTETMEKATALSSDIEAIDIEKKRTIANAKFPIEGLSFDNECNVLFNGIPFSQASSAEQLRISLAIGLALNPKLKVILIRDGSLLDDKSLGLVNEAAEKAGAQIWLERVGHGQECQVIIEDGSVLE